MKNNLVKLETYPQEPLPEGIHFSNDEESDNWLDNHLTEFKVKRDDLKAILTNIFNDTLENFMNTWTYDYAERVFEQLEDSQKLEIRFIEG